MIKGFIYYREDKIPFVEENYRLELFTDDSLQDFITEHNHKSNYCLEGTCIDIGMIGRKVVFLVDHSIGCTCYLRCYYVTMMPENDNFDSIGFQSPALDDVFRYKYKYLELVRQGINLAIQPKELYNISFPMGNYTYQLIYQIGHNHQLGLLEDMEKKVKSSLICKQSQYQNSIIFRWYCIVLLCL